MSQGPLLSSLISRLPLKALYHFEPILAFLLSRVIHYRKKVIVTNLQNAFPQACDHEITTITKAYYKHLARIILEALSSKSMPIHEMCERFHLTNPNLIEALCEKYGGALLLTPHFGNWEWGVSLGNQLKTPCTSFYKKLHDPKANAALLADRNRFHMTLEPVNLAARVLLKHKNTKTSYVLLFDQQPSGTKQTAWMNFLNQATEINTAPAKMAAQFGYPLIYLKETSVKKGYYQITALLIEESPKKEDALRITKKYMHILEKQIIDNPSQWLWSHRRWKSKKPDHLDISDD
jgi:KDO2-lipid IV(A) lauroyltransferase